MNIIYTKHPPVSGLGQDIKIISGILNGNTISITAKYIYDLIDHKKDPLKIQKMGKEGQIKRLIFLEHIDPLLLGILLAEPGPDKPVPEVFFVPNYDFITKTTVENLGSVDKLLCKTHDAIRITKTMTTLIKSRKPELYKKLKFTTHFISFTSVLNDPGTQKPSSEFVKLFPTICEQMKTLFFHPAGQSPYKNTDDVIDIWLSNSSLIDSKNIRLLITRRAFPGTKFVFPESKPLKKIPVSDSVSLYNYKNVYVTEFLPVPEYEYIMGLPNTICLMPSEIEGFGHVINQARTSAVVMTTDAPPMSEFLSCLDKKYRDLCLLKPDLLPFLDSTSSGYSNSERKIGFAFMKSARFQTPKTREAFVKALHKVSVLPIAERKKIIEKQKTDFTRQRVEFLKLAGNAFGV